MRTGAYTYNAPARISGSSASEAFTYMLADGDGGTASALLSITVTSSSSNPCGSKTLKVAADDAITPLDATFTSAGGVKFVAFKLDYDPELVTVADAEPGDDLGLRAALLPARREQARAAVLDALLQGPPSEKWHL
jgi:hypothetical protein